VLYGTVWCQIQSYRRTKQSGNIMNKAIIFDRDGVLNYTVQRENEVTAPWTLKEFKMIPGSIEAIEMAKELGYLALVATNQPDVRDKKMKDEELEKINKSLQGWLHVDEIKYADDRDSNLYKPNTGMLDYYVEKYDLEREKCFMIGDRWKDIVAGKNAKMKTIFIGDYSSVIWPEEYKSINPDFITDNVLSAVKIIGESND